MKTIIAIMMFGTSFAALGIQIPDLGLSQKGYEEFEAEIAEVSHGNINEGDFAGFKLFTKSKLTICAKRVTALGSASYKCQEVINPPVAKTLFGFPRAIGRVLALMPASPPLSPEKSEAMYKNMQNIPEENQGTIREGDLAGQELFTRSILVVYARMQGPDGARFVKKLMMNPSLE